MECIPNVQQHELLLGDPAQLSCEYNRALQNDRA